MTIVSARKYPDLKEIRFTSDNLIVSYNSTKESKNGISKPSIKLLQTEHLIIGGSGCLVDITLLFIYARLNVPKDSKPENIIQWLIDFYKIERPGFTASEHNEYLICFKDKLFSVSDLYHVQEVEEYYSIGSGQRYAQSAMYLGFDPDVAAATACEFDTSCGGELFSYTHMWI